VKKEIHMLNEVVITDPYEVNSVLKDLVAYIEGTAYSALPTSLIREDVEKILKRERINIR
jgi:hypothetical protein